MAIAIGTGGFNTGRDCTIVLIGPYGTVTLTNVTSFRSSAKYAQIKVDNLNGEQMDAALPKGWDFSFSLERGDANVDQLIAQIEQDWLVNGNYAVATLYQYIKELPGKALTTLQFKGCTIMLSDAGTYSSDQSVKITLSGTATERDLL